MNAHEEHKGGAHALKEEVKRQIFGGVESVTSSLDGWTVYLRDPDDLSVCPVQMWADLPVKYTVLSGASA